MAVRRGIDFLSEMIIVFIYIFDSDIFLKYIKLKHFFYFYNGFIYDFILSNKLSKIIYFGNGEKKT